MKCSDFDGRMYIENSLYKDLIETCLHLAVLYIDKTEEIPKLRLIPKNNEEIIGWIKIGETEKRMKSFMKEECEKVTFIEESHDIPKNIKVPDEIGTYFLVKKNSILIWEKYKD